MHALVPENAPVRYAFVSALFLRFKVDAVVLTSWAVVKCCSPLPLRICELYSGSCCIAASRKQFRYSILVCMDAVLGSMVHLNVAGGCRRPNG